MQTKSLNKKTSSVKDDKRTTSHQKETHEFKKGNVTLRLVCSRSYDSVNLLMYVGTKLRP